jgi:hypothetical protein
VGHDDPSQFMAAATSLAYLEHGFVVV